MLGTVYSSITSSKNSTGDITPPTPITNLSLIDLNIVSGNAPVLSNFTVEDAQPTRVYFDSSVPITATTTNSFTISDRTISGVTIATGLTTGHYFTVSLAFNWWNNNTIRYEGQGSLSWTSVDKSNLVAASGGAELLDFTLTYITNNIVEPVISGTDYYVTTTGNNANDGLTEGNAFLTLQEALDIAVAGDTIYMKTGTYVVTTATTTSSSGTAVNPIKIIGYKSTINDITSNYYTFNSTLVAPTLDDTEMPVIDGNQTHITGINFSNNYYVVKNVQVIQCFRGVSSTVAISNIVIDRCNFKDMYGTGAEEGAGIFLAEGKTGSTAWVESNYRILNSNALNGGVTNMTIAGAYNLIINCKTYCDKSGAGGTLGSDYYYTLQSRDSMLINSQAYAIDATVNGSSHGLSIKGREIFESGFKTPCEYNLIDGCYIKTASQEGTAFRNVGVNYNVIKNTEVEGFGQGSTDGVGVSLQSGSRYNISENNYYHNLYTFIRLRCATESGTTPADLHTSDSIIRNCILSTGNYVTRIYNSSGALATFKNNKLYNLTIDNVSNFNRGIQADLTNFDVGLNEIKNCIVDGVSAENSNSNVPSMDDLFTVIDTNNWFASWTTSKGLNSINVDSGFSGLFVPSNTALNVGLNLNDYDYDDVERRTDATSTIGAKEI